MASIRYAPSWSYYDNCKYSQYFKKAEKNMNDYPSLINLNRDKRFLIIDVGGSEPPSFHESKKAAVDYATRKLREGREFLVLETVCSVRPKPLDAEVEDFYVEEGK